MRANRTRIKHFPYERYGRPCQEKLPEAFQNRVKLANGEAEISRKVAEHYGYSLKKISVYVGFHYFIAPQDREGRLATKVIVYPHGHTLKTLLAFEVTRKVLYLAEISRYS